MPKHDSIDPELVRELALLVTETGLSEIEVEKGDLRIRVARRIEPVSVQVASPAPVAAVAAPAAIQMPAALAPSEPVKTDPGTVPSPMVGTAYLRPSPRRRRSSMWARGSRSATSSCSSKR